jgi:hypothetical protein
MVAYGPRVRASFEALVRGARATTRTLWSSQPRMAASRLSQ